MPASAQSKLGPAELLARCAGVVGPAPGSDRNVRKVSARVRREWNRFGLFAKFRAAWRGPRYGFAAPAALTQILDR